MSDHRNAPRETRTTCPYCGVGCGVLARVSSRGDVSIEGDPDHPANYGRLCSKGRALGETLGLEGRLLHPRVFGRETSWDEALTRVADAFLAAMAEHGPQSVAFYGSGQFLTEDYYVANKLMKGFIGAANIDTNSRLCMASSVAGHKRAFGADVVPGLYEDIELADLVVLVGSNLASCHPVLHQRLEAERARRRIDLVVVDPRRSQSAEAADLHLALRADGDVALFRGLATWLTAQGHADPAMRDRLAQADASPIGLAEASRHAGLPIEKVRSFYELFARTTRVVTIFSQGVNQSESGVDKVNAIIDCHLLTGRIGRPGMGPFSVTGQPNAMGGREVGGLAHLLAAHMDIADARARDRVARFWKAPRIAERPGLKAVDLFRAVRRGEIKALWIMATNPVVSMPDADAVAEAIRACPFVVVSDSLADTETTRLAHVLLPASAWGEKSGTVTNSERRISRQRAFLGAPGEARPDWAIVSDVARRMGFEGFDHAGPAEIFAEHAALSGFENAGARAFDISAHAGIDARGYEALEPFLWPAPAKPGASPVDASGRFFAEGRFFTPDGKAAVIAPALPRRKEDDGALTLDTGRIRDQWHTMTRTGKSPRLMAQYSEPFIELAPEDAARLGVRAASLVEVKGERGFVILRALISARQVKGAAFAPMHWSEPFAAPARVNSVACVTSDPISGQPALKGARVRVAPAQLAWHAVAIGASRPRCEAVALDYYAFAPVDGGFRVELAGRAAPPDWTAFLCALFGLDESIDWVAMHDAARGAIRLAGLSGDRLAVLLIAGPGPVEAARDHLASALSKTHAGPDRLRLLAGRPGADEPDRGAIICACMNVGDKQIGAAIAAGAGSIEEVGARCEAGTGCGSCRVDIRRMIDASAVRQAG